MNENNAIICEINNLCIVLTGILSTILLAVGYHQESKMGKVVLIFLAMLLVTALAKPHKKDTLDRIKKFNSMKNTWTAGYTEFSALSEHEKKQLLGALLLKGNIKRKIVPLHANIPDSFDARDQWPDCPTMNTIKDQGDCGSCWAVSTAAAASDRLCIATNYQTSLNLSAENLMACCSDCSSDGGCNGGWPTEAWTYLTNTGIVTGGAYNSNEGCQPYQIAPTGYSAERSEYISTPACEYSCTNSNYGVSYSDDFHYASKGYSLNDDVSQIQSDLLENGPNVACFEVYEDFYDYTSGVYSYSYGKYLGNHAVKIIGWGTDDNGVDYWLVANSWNRSFGEKGFFKIKRGNDECGFEDQVSGGYMKS